MPAIPRSQQRKHKKQSQPGLQGKIENVANRLDKFLNTYLSLEYAKKVLIDPEYTWVVATFCFLSEIVLNYGIITYRSCKFSRFLSFLITLIN